MSLCHICPRHAHPDGEPCQPGCATAPATTGHACTGCRTRLADHLDQLPDLHALIAATPWPQPWRHGPRSADTPLPGGTERLSWLQGADTLAVLNDWIGLLADTLRLATRAKPTLAQACAHLRQHLDNICRQLPALPDLANEVAALHRRAQRLAGQADTTPIQCPAPGCGRALRVDIGAPDTTIACPACRTDWTPARLLRLITSGDGEAWLDAETCARALGIDQRTLRRWHTAGHAPRRGGLYELRHAQRHAEECA